MTYDDQLLEYLNTAINNLVPAFGLSEEESVLSVAEFQKRLLWGEADTLLTLLLAITSQESLSSVSAFPNYFNHLPNPSDPSHRYFKHLRHLTLSHWDDEGGYSFAHLTQFLALETLTSLSCHRLREGCVPRDGSNTYWDLPSKSSNIEHLSFSRSSLTPMAFSEILRLPKALKSFTLELGIPLMRVPSFNASDLQEALRVNCSETLEELRILPSGPIPRNTNLTGFSTFQRLRVMDLPMPILWPMSAVRAGRGHLWRPMPRPTLDSSMLPKTLEDFTIRNGNGIFDIDFFLELTSMKRRGDGLPGLRKLMLENPRSYIRDRNGRVAVILPKERENFLRRDDVRELERSCDETGIRFTVEYQGIITTRTVVM
jgi:hypothetical protein